MYTTSIWIVKHKIEHTIEQPLGKGIAFAVGISLWFAGKLNLRGWRGHGREMSRSMCKPMNWIVLGVVLIFLSPARLTWAEDSSSKAPREMAVGTIELGLSTGYLLPWQLPSGHTAKQQGPGAFPSFGVVLSETLGERWYQGQIILGFEATYFAFREPQQTHGIGAMPRFKYLFTGQDRLRPYVEFGVGPFFEDIGGVLQRFQRFNFSTMAGGGVSWFWKDNLSLNAGLRHYHFHYGGTGDQALGANSFLPFVGVSYYIE